MPSFEYRKQKENEYKKKTDDALDNLPVICSVYVNGIEGYTTPLTVYTYIKRLGVFFRYAVEKNLIAEDEVHDFKFEHLDDISLLDIESFLHWLRAGNASDGDSLKESSINNYLSALNSFWDYAQTRGFISHNIIKDIKRAKKIKKPALALDKQQTKDLIHEVDKGTNLTKHQDDYRSLSVVLRDRAIMLLLVKTGLRVSELVGINVDDVNLKKHFVRVYRKESKIMNVFFSDEVGDAIEDYMRERHNFSPKDGENALFLSSMGRAKGTRLSVRSVQILVKKYGAAAVPEYGYEITPHKMRSTYATQMIKQTGDLSLVQQLMAHESPSTTAIYLSSRAEEMEHHRNDL